ncbi:hypothetical protein DFJ74DRAFT_687350 [Hyaloraphidium curvatum]|nr:hypothetical protein DFJ74DRAFT_687350 [Hyaloraphidium curvatum]
MSRPPVPCLKCGSKNTCRHSPAPYESAQERRQRGDGRQEPARRNLRSASLRAGKPDVPSRTFPTQDGMSSPVPPFSEMQGGVGAAWPVGSGSGQPWSDPWFAPDKSRFNQLRTSDSFSDGCSSPTASVGSTVGGDFEHIAAGGLLSLTTRSSGTLTWTAQDFESDSSSDAAPSPVGPASSPARGTFRDAALYQIAVARSRSLPVLTSDALLGDWEQFKLEGGHMVDVPMIVFPQIVNLPPSPLPSPSLAFSVITDHPNVKRFAEDGTAAWRSFMDAVFASA